MGFINRHCEAASQSEAEAICEGAISEIASSAFRSPRNDVKPSVWLSRYTKLLALVTFLLIIAGGLVTSTDSGLSVPDWPLSYGKWMPPMVGGIRYEHAHRMIASGVGLMTLVLAFWLGVSEKRTWVRWTGIAALGMVVAQGILGGMTVLYLLPAPISIVHACLAQTFFALVVSLAFFTSREWTAERGMGSESWSELRYSLVLLIVLIYVQLILGAALRHTENRVIVISHVTSGFLVLIHSIFVMMRVLRTNHQDLIAPQGLSRSYGIKKSINGIASEAKQSQVSKIASAPFVPLPRNDCAPRKLVYPALSLGTITVLQMSLGIGAFAYTMMIPELIQPERGRIFFVTAHQSFGALLLATSVFLALRVYRRSRQI